jgi:hypothetical protein
MELIIMFIVMLIISSLMRAWKGAGSTAEKRRRPPAPAAPSFPFGLPGLPGMEPEERTFGDESTFWEINSLERPLERPKGRLAKTSPGKKKKAALPEVTQEKQETISPAAGEKSSSLDEFRGLLGAGKLPVIILASEILAAPRARNPMLLRSPLHGSFDNKLS